VRWAAYPVRLFIVTRLAILALVAITLYLLPGLYNGVGMSRIALSTVDGLCQWDCQLYAEVTKYGYRSVPMFNFWPLLPLAAHPLTWLHASPRFAVVLVANGAALVGFIAVYRTFLILEDEETARWGTTLFAAYPFAFFFAGGFSESLMVGSSAAAMALALGGRDVAGGAALAAGILARHTTVFTGLGLLVKQLEEVRGDLRLLFTRRQLLGLILPIPILLLWPLYSFLRFHDALLFVHARVHWTWQAWTSVVGGWHKRGDMPILAVYPFICWIPALGALLLLLRRRWWPLAAIALPLMALFLAVGACGLGRYSASCWPAFLPLGAWLRRRRSLQVPLVVALALLQGLFLHLYAHGFNIQ
jgi:hypothetical protein